MRGAGIKINNRVLTSNIQESEINPKAKRNRSGST
jgi:hypothetical protein